jgi:hypothetical protein
MAALELLWKIQVTGVGPGMLIDKLADGVVRVQTPIGPRYVVPSSFLQRAYLVWMFRHFPILPHAVLSSWQKRMIDRMCSEQSFSSRASSDGTNRVPVIGTVEHRPLVHAYQMPQQPTEAGERSGVLSAEARQRP